MITENPTSPGDLKKFVVMLNGNDVTASVISFDIFQDIFSPTWSAKFFLEDTMNLLATLPIKAGMEITAKIETNFGGFVGDAEKEFSFIIYRIGDKEMKSQAHQSYTVFAADKAFIENQKKRVSRAFTNQSPQNIVSTLVQEELGGGSVDAHSSDDNLSIIIPNWTPFNAVGWVQRVALCDGAADYCFFQTDKNKFAFKSFERMYSAKSERVERPIFMLRPANKYEDGNYPEDFTGHIQQFQWQHFDGMAGVASGMYKSKTVSFDFITKNWNTKTFSYGEDTSADNEGKNFEDIMSGEDSNVTFMPKHSGMFDQGASHLDTIEKWVGSRKSAVQKMDTEKLIIQIGGAVKAWEWLGKNIQIELPAQEDMTGEKLDKTRKGNYVVIAICHNVRKDAYMVNMECIRKRLNKEDTK